MAERTGEEVMDIKQWEMFCKAYPRLLLHIFKLQRTMQASHFTENKLDTPNS